PARRLAGIFGGNGPDQALQTLEREGEVSSPLARHEGVDLVDDDRTNILQTGAASLAREQQVEGLWGGHQDVWWILEHPRPVARRGVTRANARRDFGNGAALALELVANACERLTQVELDVTTERLEG